MSSELRENDEVSGYEIRRIALFLKLFNPDPVGYLVPRAGSGVARIDPLRFLARCRKRRLNQTLSVLSEDDEGLCISDRDRNVNKKVRIGCLMNL